MQWHQLDHMQTICTLLQTDYHINTPSLNLYRPDALSDTQPTVSKHWRQNKAMKAIKVIAKGSPYSITCRVLELIPVLGSQPAGDVSHKPGGRLPLLSARPAVTLATLMRAATNFAAWWTEAQWVWTVCLRLLPDSVMTAIWTRTFYAWVQYANHSATEPPHEGNDVYNLSLQPKSRKNEPF